MATLRDIQDRLGFQADGTWYQRAAGQHTLKLGAQFDRIGNDVYNGYQKQRVLFYWGDAYAATDGTLYPSPYGYARVYYYGIMGDVRSDNWGLFVQDSWTLGSRFTLNLGLRTKHEKVPSFSTGEGVPTTAIDFGFADKIAPRVGFSWDLRGDGRFKAYGSWGIFYDIMKLEMPRSSFGRRPLAGLPLPHHEPGLDGGREQPRVPAHLQQRHLHRGRGPAQALERPQREPDRPRPPAHALPGARPRPPARPRARDVGGGAGSARRGGVHLLFLRHGPRLRAARPADAGRALRSPGMAAGTWV